MAHVLITGGAGYIGSELTKYLIERGHRISILDRCFFGQDSIRKFLKNEKVTLYKEDIRYFDPSLLTSVDVVMDLAGLSNDPSCDLDPQITMDINYKGCVRVANLAKQAGVKRYIFSSSCSVYGHGTNLELDETSEPQPVSVYARAKKLAETEILPLSDSNFCVTCLRNATVYGLSAKMRFDLVVNVMTYYAYRHNKIYVLGGGLQWRPVVHIKDVCQAFEVVMQSDQSIVNGQIFNVGSNDQNYQIIQIAHIISRAIPGTQLECIPDDPDKRTYNVCFDKIHSKLSYKAEKRPIHGVLEIYEALCKGDVDTSIKTKTVDYYKFLIDAERTIRTVLYNGTLF